MQKCNYMCITCNNIIICAEHAKRKRRSIDVCILTCCFVALAILTLREAVIREKKDFFVKSLHKIVPGK